MSAVEKFFIETNIFAILQLRCYMELHSNSVQETHSKWTTSYHSVSVYRIDKQAITVWWVFGGKSIAEDYIW